MNHKEFMHYASPYYDPVKAKEYYERTKKLKGRRSTRRMTENQKRTWAFVKENVKIEKKQKNERQKEKTKQEVEMLRQETAAAREQIALRIKKRLATRFGAKGEREALTNKLKSAIEDIRGKAKEIREALNVSTEAILDEEYDKIVKTLR